MQFILQCERQETERKKIEVRGVLDTQVIVGQGLNDTTLRWFEIQPLRELAKSENAKVILMNDLGQQFFIQADTK
jgi:hypothetical protein